MRTERSPPPRLSTKAVPRLTLDRMKKEEEPEKTRPKTGTPREVHTKIRLRTDDSEENKTARVQPPVLKKPDPSRKSVPKPRPSFTAVPKTRQSTTPNAAFNQTSRHAKTDSIAIGRPQRHARTPTAAATTTYAAKSPRVSPRPSTVLPPRRPQRSTSRAGSGTAKIAKGPINLGLASSKPPAEMLSEAKKSLDTNRIAYKLTSQAFALRCQKQSLRFDLEIMRVEGIPNLHVI